MDKIYEKIVEVLEKSPIYIVGILSLLFILVGIGAIRFGPDGNWEIAISENLKTVLLVLGGIGFLIFVFMSIKLYFKKKVDTNVPSMTKERVEIYNILLGYIGINQFHYICVIIEGHSFKIDVESIIAPELIETHEKMRPLMRNHNWNEKVEQYRKYAIKMVRLSQAYDKTMDNELEQGDIIRLVFDVEEGGVFYGKLIKGKELENGKAKEKSFVFAATLDQKSMDECTKKLGIIVDKLRELKNLPPIILSTE